MFFQWRSFKIYTSWKKVLISQRNHSKNYLTNNPKNGTDHSRRHTIRKYDKYLSIQFTKMNWTPIRTLETGSLLFIPIKVQMSATAARDYSPRARHHDHDPNKTVNTAQDTARHTPTHARPRRRCATHWWLSWGLQGRLCKVPGVCVTLSVPGNRP